MEEKSRFAVGIDIGTKNVRAVQGTIGRDGQFTVIGYGEVQSSGMRRGSIREMRGPSEAVDECLRKVESMSGINVESATIGINGMSITSTKADGMITVLPDHDVDIEDIDRLNNAAITGRIQQNRRILDVIPFEYILDSQRGIREPIGMKGSRLEIRANIISALAPEYDNLQSAMEQISLHVSTAAPTVMAAADAILTDQQRENGIGVVDFGDSTTGVAIYDEGELQYLAVIPIGSNDITKDLATYLQTVPEIADEIKLRFVTGKFGENTKDVTIKRGRDEYIFSRTDIEEAVEARLEEIFEKVRKCLKEAGYDKKLPEGLMLTGGGAKMRDIDIYARSQVELAVRIGKPGQKIANANDEFCKPEFSAAIGLMMRDGVAFDGAESAARPSKKAKSGKSGGGLKKIFGFFK